VAEHRQISRREFLRRAGIAGYGAIVAACGPRPATPTPFASPAPKTLLLAIQSFAHAAMRPVLDAWTAQTGHQVRLVDGPAEGREMITRYSPDFQARRSPVDLFSVSDDSGPFFYRAGWIEPLDDVIPQATWDDFPKIFNSQLDLWHGYAGRRYRVPHEFAIGYFWYRKDWLDQRGAKPPETWEELVAIGKQFTSGSVTGTLEALIKPGLLFAYLAYLTAQAGGNIFSFDDQTAVAFQFLYELIYTHRILPESALNTGYGQQNDAYMSDRVAMMRQWPFFLGVARENTGWYMADKVAIALPPAGPAGSKSWWGGWGFSVPAFAPNKDAALDLLRWITDTESAPILAKGQSWFMMPRKSILAALGDEGIAPAMKRYIESNVISERPFHERVLDAQGIVDDIGALFLTKQISLATAMQRGAEQIKALG
jgi:multiple sugar transport system substrate-binding protein